MTDQRHNKSFFFDRIVSLCWLLLLFIATTVTSCSSSSSSSSSSLPETTTTTTTTSRRRNNVASLSDWATQEGIEMHSALQWKHYGGTNWGFELKESVPPGTHLMRVPRKLVLESGPIYEEFKNNKDYYYTEPQL